MTNKRITSLAASLSLAAALLSFPAAFAADKPAVTAPADATKPAYPLATCIVSGDSLEEMGHPVDYVYKQPGKPDRHVRFCCKDCIEDFEKDPAKYLKTLDKAEAAPAAKARPAPKAKE